MRITRKDEFQVRDKIDKLAALSHDKAMKLIYEWVKQDAIDCGVHLLLCKFVHQLPNETKT
jgi:hypothetical protein